MPKIYVNYREIRDANYMLPRMESKAISVKRRIHRLKNNISQDISEQYEIGQRLYRVCRQIGELEEKINQLYQVTNYCMMQYEEAEYENVKNAEAFC